MICFDQLTGLMQKEDFFGSARRLLADAADQTFCIVAVDIENFRFFNEWYGKEAGDQFLVNIANLLRQTVGESGLAARMADDEFAVLAPDQEEIFTVMQEKVMHYVRQFSGNAGFLPAFGVYHVTDNREPVDQMYDRAAIAMKSVKGKYLHRLAVYDMSMLQKMETTFIFLSEIQRGLSRGEFVFYVQPKCNMLNGRIISLESLVRWQHPERGLLLPGEFVPFLESNGFITNLDLYIWDLVCQRVRNWISEGHQPIPISVNVSCQDLVSLDIVRHFRELIEKYDLPADLIEIEISEKFNIEESVLVQRAVDGLRGAGFTVLMDNFGNGYSAMELMQRMNIDVLKIDMRTACPPDAGEKEESILTSVTRMAKLMALRVMAKGVETREEVELLLDLGCNYCQGNYYYRPMPPDVLESIMLDEKNIDYNGIHADSFNRFLPSEWIDWAMLSESMLNHILGAVAFYQVCDDNVEIVRVSEQYYRLMDVSPMDLEENKRSMDMELYEEDRDKLFALFAQAKHKPAAGAHGILRRRKEDGGYLLICMRVYYIKQQDGGDMYYASLSDVTESSQNPQENVMTSQETAHLEMEKEYRYLNRKMLSVMHMTGINSWEWDISENRMQVLSATCLYPLLNRQWFDKQKHVLIAKDFPGCILNEQSVPYGYYPSTQEFIERAMENRTGDSIRTEFPLCLAPERVVWIRVVCETLFNEKDEPSKLVGYYEDISKEKQQTLQLQKMAETDALTGLYNRIAAVTRIRKYLANRREETAALIMFDLDDFKLANDIFGHAFGDFILQSVAEKLSRSFRSEDIACRFGGDEFMIFCKGIPEEVLLRKLDAMTKTFPQTYEKDGEQIRFTFSSGYVMIPEQGVLYEDLCRRADVALFAAKMGGKCTYRKYDASMKEVRSELACGRCQEPEDGHI